MKPIHKISIFLGVGILAIVGIYLGWRAFVSPPADTGGSAENPDVTVETPSSAEDVFRSISDEKVFDFWVNSDTGEVFYFTPDGRVMNAKEGSDIEISAQTVSALNFVKVGPNGQKVLAAFGDPQSPQWGIFDVIDGVWRPLPSDVINATWGEDNEELIAVIRSGNDLNLTRADITDTPPSYRTLIRDFRLKNVRLEVLPEEKIIVSEAPSASYSASLWQVELSPINFSLLIANELGLDVSWSSDKDITFLFSQDSGFSFSDDGLQTKISAPFVTLPKKCASENTKIYCFVPQNIPSGTVLPDDYLTEAFFSVDNLFTVGIESGEITRILSSNTADIPAIDAKKPRVSGDKIYFVNRYDDGLYEMSL